MLIKVNIPQPKNIKSVRLSDFRIFVGDILTSVEYFLDGIPPEVEEEKQSDEKEKSEVYLTQSLVLSASILPCRSRDSKEKTD